MLWINKTHCTDRYSKNNKLLYWYVSITGLSKKSQQLQVWLRRGNECVPEQLMQPPRGASTCTSIGTFSASGMSLHGLREEQPWEPVSVGATAHRSSLRVLLITAVEAREPILLSKVKRLKPCNHANTCELATILKLSSCRE